LVVRLLGAVEIIFDGRRLRAFNSLRLQRFLALIVLRRDAQQRSRLAFELWPDSAEGQARTNLRKLLHELRRSLPEIEEFVEIDNRVVRWLPNGPSEVDVLRFRDAIAGGDRELATRLYSGDLLPACYDDWVLEEREALRGEACAALAELVEEAGSREDHDATIRHARRLLELESTDEAAARNLMAAQLALGDRAAALRSYHRYAEALERELGLGPGEEVERLYRELRSEAPGGDGEPGDEIPPVGESPFVGRGPELARLEELWNGARERGAHLALVTGEPGIGKTRLARELGRLVRGRGHTVAAARAYEAAGRVPWGPVIDLLRSPALEGAIDTLDPAWRRELARLLPEFEDAEPSGPKEPAERRRLFDAVSRAIFAGDRPRLLILDDLQWCDTETIELIGFVVRTGRTAPLLVVGTVRSEELPEEHPLRPLVDALGRDQAVTTVELERLDEAATTTLAARLTAGGTLEPQLAERLWSETEGNPLFVIESVRAGLSSGSALTPTIRAVLSARLGQLTDATRRTVETAAVIGRSFSVELLVRASGGEELELVEQLDELWRRRLVHDQGPTYDFAHDKLREVTLEKITPARRRRLHRAVAEAIEAEHEGRIAAVAPRLAAHYEQAGRIEPAIDAYRTAAARAVEVSALDEAVTLLRRALSLLADLPGSADRDALELDLRIGLGSPLVALEGYGSETSHRLYERAQALCRRLSRPVDPPILRGLGLARLQGCRFEECDEAARSLLEQGAPIARTEGHYLLGVSAFWQGELTKSGDHLRAAIDSYDAALRGEHLASYAQDPKAVCLVRLGWVELWAGDPGRADKTVRSGLDLARELDHLMTLWYALTYAAIVAAESEDLARLAELLEEAELVWSRLPERYLAIVGEALRGWLEVCEGSLGGIERILQAAVRSRSEGESLHLSYTLLLLARARGLAGEHDRGRAATREALSWTERTGQRYVEAELRRADGELAFRAGETEDASGSLHKAVEVAAAQGARWLELRALQACVRRFPDRSLQERLRELVDATPSGRDLPAFRAATDLLRSSE
jgi:DNA-binding SARP family transcriptional activator